jgi:hypothetical protein
MDADLTDTTDLTDLLALRVDRMGKGFGRVIRAWQQVTGRYVARHTMPTRLAATTDASGRRVGVELRVRCSSAAWTSEILHLEQQLLAQLAPVMAPHRITRIKPYTGRMPADPRAMPERPAPQLPPLPADAIERIHVLAARIEDEALRATVTRAMIATTASRLNHAD